MQIWNILFQKILTIYFFGNPIFSKSNPPQKNKPTPSNRVAPFLALKSFTRHWHRKYDTSVTKQIIMSRVLWTFNEKQKTKHSYNTDFKKGTSYLLKIQSFLENKSYYLNLIFFKQIYILIKTYNLLWVHQNF